MKAACPYYRQCSGCQRLQFPYVKQLRDKNKWLGELFAPVPGAPAALSPLVASEPAFAYRSSAKLCLHEDVLGRRAIGLYERGTKNVVAIPACPVQAEGINRLVQRLFRVDQVSPAPFYNHQKARFQEGCLKFITLRYCPTTGEAGVILSHTGVSMPALKTWVERLGLSGVAFYASILTKEDGANVLGRQAEHVAGPTRFRYAIGQEIFSLHPMAFFQANHILAPAFVEAVTESHRAGGETLLDLYAGFGAYSSHLMNAFKQVILVDGNPDATTVAQENLVGKGQAKLTVSTAFVEAYLWRMTPAMASQVTDIVVNPPRLGMHRDAVAALSAKKFPALRRLTYVSCQPTALKRDLLALAKLRPWRFGKLQPFDMFPHTDHVEVVADLSFT